MTGDGFTFLGYPVGTFANSSHTHAGADVASGTVATARLDVGTTSGTVAAGNDFRLTAPHHLGVPLTAGESNADRRWTQANSAAAATQQLVLTYFTAVQTETINQMVIYTSVTAGASLSLIRYAAYTVATNGDLTLAASTANDTTLFAAANTRYPKALQAAWAKTAGQRYAVGYLCVGTTQPSPLRVGAATLSLQDTIYGQSPRITGLVTGQADLPATVAAASVTVTRHYPYVEMLP